MRIRLSLTLLAGLALTSPAMAQQYQGNWWCTDGQGRTGILTIYVPSYGFASHVVGDTASGIGGATGYTDGVSFDDGNLRGNLGVEAGRLATGETGGLQLRLETNQAVAMLCQPR